MRAEDEPAAEGPEDERELFRRAVRDVRPLKGSQRVLAPRRAPRARAGFARAERAAPVAGGSACGEPAGTDLFEVQAGDELLFRRPGVPQTVVRRLRRGQYRVGAELDLHGCTVAQAHAALDAFLQVARARHLQCVRIIHGKGLRSGTRGPVLKNWVNAQLRAASPVLAFASAAAMAGGTGATLVLLRHG